MRRGSAAEAEKRTGGTTPGAARVKALEVFLVRPTKYDDEGYLLRHLRGVLPTNSLACLHALTEEVAAAGTAGDVLVRAHLCDESVEAVPERRILRTARREGSRAIVCLVGVQTNQFPRAADLARRFRRHGIDVILGGFHVSGVAAMLPELPREIRELMDDGVTIAVGEVEETWGAILRDAAAGRLAPLYDSLADKPDLSRAPVPRLHPRALRKFVYRHFGTVDAGRGCPFTCTFCTIINVQGRAMRSRGAAAIAAAVESSYRATGTHHYFFTDDNFARNGNWREIFTELVRLREKRGIPVRFLMQVDVLSHRIPDFIPLAARAGCFQVFIGMESLNPESLLDGGKRQNKVGDYRALIDAWHGAGVLTHVGYIIGFPHDTPANVRDGVRTLVREVRADIASFFMLTPLPGSADHLRLTREGVRMDDDLNGYDTFRPVLDHPEMSRQEWFALYREAWSTFYQPDHMREQLERLPPRQRVTLLQMYLWYMCSAFVDELHPMMSGFFRLKPRADRRPGFAVEGRLRHLRRRLPELFAEVRGYVRVLRTVGSLWVESGGGEVADREVFLCPNGAGRWERVRAGLRLGAVFLRQMFVGADGDRGRAGEASPAEAPAEALTPRSW